MQSSILKKLHSSEVKILDEIVRVCNENNLQYFLIGGTLLGAVRHKGFIPWDDDLDIAMPREDYEKFLQIANSCLKKDFVLDYINENPDYWLVFAKVRIKNSLMEVSNVLEEYPGEKGIWVDIFPLDSIANENSFTFKIRGTIIQKLKAIYIMKSKYALTDSERLRNLLPLFKKISMQKMNNIITKMMIAKNKPQNIYIVNYGSQYGIKKQTHLKEKYFPAAEVEFEGKMYKAPRDYDYVLKKIYGDNYMELPPIEKRVTHNPIKIKFEDGEEYTFDEATTK